jgi:hypothetical protein
MRASSSCWEVPSSPNSGLLKDRSFSKPLGFRFQATGIRGYMGSLCSSDEGSTFTNSAVRSPSIRSVGRSASAISLGISLRSHLFRGVAGVAPVRLRMPRMETAYSKDSIP